MAELITTDSIIYIVETTSIFVGATFGILGTVTTTKDKKDNLTKWGKIAVVGILITNLFALADGFYKHQKDQQTAINASKKEANALKLQNIRYQNQLNYLNTILGKVNTSVNSLGKNLQAQHELINESKNISRKQNEGLKFILGTGSPVLYMHYSRDTTGTYKLVNLNHYPMYDVRINIFEKVSLFPRFDPKSGRFTFLKQWTLDKSFGSVNTKGAIYESAFYYPFKASTIIFYVTISTRNGSFSETVLFRKNGEKYNVGMLYKNPSSKTTSQWVSGKEFYRPGEIHDLEKIIRTTSITNLGAGLN